MDRRGAFTEIETERIRVVGPDGQLALAIAHAGGLPGPMMDGRQYSQEVSGGRTRAAGMIFFNDQGDEVGGLTYHGELADDGYRAVGHLSLAPTCRLSIPGLAGRSVGEARHMR